MRLRVTHTTEYRYTESVPLCHNVARLRPRQTDRQVCQSARLVITPEPESRHDRIDFWGNHSTCFSIQSPHAGLKIVSKNIVEVWPVSLDASTGSGAWDSAILSINQSLEPRPLYARQFTFDSPRITRQDALLEYAQPSFSQGRPLMECVCDLNQRIRADFQFDPKATKVDTPVEDVLKLRRGVCQDFAHLMIGGLRSLGLAARYVSGYLLTHPAPGKERLRGVDASHAWVSVYFPDAGWIDFDPTNGMLPATDHVTLGWARDYDDIAPVKGIITGGHKHSLVYSVDVEPYCDP